MTPFPWADLAIIAALIVLNGLFAMSELAIVSARRARLKVALDEGRAGARQALQLASEPGKFLSTVQIGISLVAIIAGAYSGSSLGGPVGERLAALGVPADYAPEAGFALVIVIVTYLSLVVGELVPKQLALRAPEKIAMLAAPPMAFLARLAAPLVWLLEHSSSLVLRLFGARRSDPNHLTDEELHMIFAEATRSGVLEEEERAIMTGIMRLADRPVREVMTPRTEIDWIDADASLEEIKAAIAASPHSLMPVAKGSPDEVVGVVKTREVLAQIVDGRVPQLASLMARPEIVPDQLDSIDGLRMLQQADVAMAMVHDEYGHLDGIVTPADLLQALVGEFASDRDLGDGPQVVEREDGSLLISGAMPADALAERLGMTLPDEREYATAAGYVLAMIKRIPQAGDYFEDEGWRIEVVDMDGRKIDKLLVARVKGEPEVAEAE
ncbi:MAG: DNA-binding protein [Sphingomonadales bacterium CG12_big_fil_rev_8_21_14_0_65_65_10]|nr:MAG: DNA-binding protein [Sphingomonadales bacterium CG12_big_fil_rev_8_21_14_0_65_65_10]